MNDKTMRETFERQMKAQFPGITLGDQQGDAYWTPMIDNMWQGFQLAWQSQQAQGEAVAYRTVDPSGRPVTDWMDGAPDNDEIPIGAGGQTEPKNRFQVAYSPAPAAVPEAKKEWAKADISWVVEFLRENSRFDADRIGEMLQFAKTSAAAPAPAEPCRYHGTDTEACEAYSGDVPCDPAESAVSPNDPDVRRRAAIESAKQHRARGNYGHANLLAEFAAIVGLERRDNPGCVDAANEAWRALPRHLQRRINAMEESLDNEPAGQEVDE